MNFGAAKRRKTTVQSDLSALYPHDLQLYRDYPHVEITLPEFEHLAIERLKVLRIIEQVSLRVGTKNYEEWKKLVWEELQKQGLKMYARLITAPGIGELESDYEARKKDHISHFILRIVYCQTEEYRKWFVAREVELFRLRWSNLPSTAQQKFLKINNFEYCPLIEEKCQELSDATGGYVKAGVEDYYEVKWTHVLELVRTRRVFLKNGMAYITSSELISVIASQFRSQLSHSLAMLSSRLSVLKSDERLSSLLQNLHHSYTGKSYTSSNNGSGKTIPLHSIDSLAKTSFPLCMRQLHVTLRTEHHLKHFGRQQYSLFLKGIGLSLEDALTFWKAEFTKKMDSDKFDKEYAYNIRHNYGKEGKRTNYTPYSCAKIISGGGGLNDNHGCPFKTSNQQGLRQLLKNVGVASNEATQDIVQLASQGHYQLACAKYFEVQHSTPMLSAIMHPNQYFEESQKILAKGSNPPDTALSATKSSSLPIENRNHHAKNDEIPTLTDYLNDTDFPEGDFEMVES